MQVVYYFLDTSGFFSEGQAVATFPRSWISEPDLYPLLHLSLGFVQL